MIEEENSRLKGLLFATTGFYLLGWLIGITFGRFLNSDAYLIWFIENSWAVWVTWCAMFLVYAWIPLTLFLFFQGIRIRKSYILQNFEGDRTIGNLSVLLPVIFTGIYFFTRVLYGS